MKKVDGIFQFIYNFMIVYVSSLQTFIFIKSIRNNTGQKNMKKILPLMIVGILFLSGLGAVAITDNKNCDIKIENELIIISKPIITDIGEYVTVNIEESTSSLLNAGKPLLPVITKVFTLPFGSEICNVDVIFSEESEIALSKEVLPGSEPVFLSTESKNLKTNVKDLVVYRNAELYPFSRYSYTSRAGLDNEEHVHYLTVRCYPVRYLPKQNIIYYSEKIEINVLYKKPSIPIVFPNEYSLVIIAPEEYSAGIQPLVEHKNNHNVNTMFKSAEEIYSEYNGRDESEQIKYFIKDAIEDFGVAYVLLIGSVYKLPMRTSYIRLWDQWVHPTLTDLYYSDIYDSDGEFCSWNSNNNSKFGETVGDRLDLYPDVYIGRLACDKLEEVETVVDKIIHYENEAFYQDWFNNMIFIGGDTFLQNPGNEGEEINVINMNIMADFNPIDIIWTSKDNFNRETISGAINKGAGFLDYSGHGFEHGMGTYPPSDKNFKTYITPYIWDLVNGYKLPIIFFDACLTTKLDFTLGDLLSYKEYQVFKILTLIPGIDEYMKLPCFAWYFVKHKGGGAIATIGATRTAFGGVEAGAGKMSIEFFKAYDSSEMLGQMMTKAQNVYITDVPWDEFTVEEFTLLGDPSLKLGGYP